MDFLRDGTESTANQQPPTAHSNPAAATEPRSNPSPSRYTLPNRPSQRTDSSSSRSSDRKRRLTTADSPMRRPSSIRMHSESAGDSSADPILVDSSPASVRALPPTPPVTSQANTGTMRRQSDIVLPPWQPDNEVSQCPFIVHPPSESIANFVDLTGEDESAMSTFGPFRNPALGGGEEVRPTRPRRQIPEEDECPICGEELPPKGPDNDDSDRTQHIEECIALHSASPGPTAALTPQTSASLPTQRTRGMSSAGNGEGASNANRMSHAARGMFPYVATEKDCVDEEGRQAECTICLEDFESGDKMARLVCWCKFHETCIKEWWDKKGRGACPTHQLQE
ncbi:hypothetical protein J4E90_005669 [Alternaria incomplexa]|uniref:uncharacterized protein n=1 Tax=Alternaria incomplexa TaxID=1187928 RepID=UPI00222001A4|nr:uncharacterized protein J4E90_005669 [Alternaria incomplexa]KAI4913949.1 hypothetical protein J4E90_005669 [Alternaria incomplexa]